MVGSSCRSDVANFRALPSPDFLDMGYLEATRRELRERKESKRMFAVVLKVKVTAPVLFVQERAAFYLEEE